MDQVILALLPVFFRQGVTGAKWCVLLIDKAQQQMMIPSWWDTNSLALNDGGWYMPHILESEF